ncbi:MAG TPA: trimethylamine methyltransferase family protein [Thermoplasmata archaeon]|nr:trimethylamine methyltransferase family protein [Thermoplasmata archaeon]
MAVARVRFLEKNEEDLVHKYSLKSLNEFGVLVRSPSVLKMLGDAGATIDEKKMIAKIPEPMVNEAVKKAPKEFDLCSRDGKHDLHLPTDKYPYVCTTGLGVYIRDIHTGKNRPSTKKDIADVIKVGDALDGMDYLWTTLTATEVPPLAHGLHELWTALQNTSKHVQGVSVGSAEECKRQIEMASLIAGGPDALRKRPIFSVICCPIAPLSFEKGAVEGQVELNKAGIPVVTMSMSLGGMSAPITLGGTILNANTENLASLVISQTANPGAPHIYSSESTPVNMMTGNISYECPEAPLISAATAQMAKRYGLPCMTGGWGAGADDPEPGLLSPLTEMTSLMLCSMGGTDLTAGAGSIDVAKGVALEQLVIDVYLWENFRGFMRKFTIDEESFALDIVRQVGHGNSFLTNPHTAKNFKNQMFFRDKKKLAWEATLSSKSVPEAKEVVLRILKEHKVDQMDASIVEKGDDIIKEFEKTHSG